MLCPSIAVKTVRPKKNDKPQSKLPGLGPATSLNAVNRPLSVSAFPTLKFTALFPSDCSVTGVDFSSSMLEKARERIARKGVQNVRLLQMDAANMKFADDTFDIVYAPYVISVVPDPVAVTREMYRVCRPGGRIVILNHFRSKSRVGARLERMIAPFTPYIGFKSDLDLPAFLVQADLKPISIEKVNIPRIWSLVICVKD